MWQLPASCLFYTWWCVYANPNPLVIPSSVPLCVYTSVFYIWVSTPALEIDLWLLNKVVRGGLIEKVSWTSWEGWQCRYLGEEDASRGQGGVGWEGRAAGVSLPPWRSWRPPRRPASLCSNAAVLSRDMQSLFIAQKTCWWKETRKMPGCDICCCFSLLFGSLFWFLVYHAKNKIKMGFTWAGSRKRASTRQNRMRSARLAFPLCWPLQDV